MTDSFRFTTRALDLQAYRWLPAGAPRAIVIFAHGWGDHGARYAEVAGVLNAAGHAAYALDFEGHGGSPGPRAQIADFQHLVSDLAAFVARVRRDHPDAALYLCGYSMGGCVCATYLAFHEHHVAGVVFNSSALIVSRHIARAKRIAARVLGNAVPTLPLANLTAGALMSRDPAQVAAYEADPQIWHGRITAGTGRQLLLANDRIGEHLDRITVPMLVLQGEADTLVDPEGARAVVDLSPVTDKTLHLYPGALHDLFHEQHREAVFADLLGWLEGRVPSAATRTADLTSASA